MPSLHQFAVTSETLDGSGSLVSVRGELDLETVAAVRRHAYQRIELHGPRLVLNLAETSFMDSSGLKLIEELRRRNADLVVIATTYAVRRLFEIAPPSSDVRVVATRQDAQLTGERRTIRA